MGQRAGSMIINGHAESLNDNSNTHSHSQIYNAYKLKSLQKKNQNKKIL